MATIILATNEEFSHSHADGSESCCVKGLVELRYADKVFLLQAGDAVRVPSGMPHVLRNLGDAEAHVQCAHSPQPD